MTKEPSGENFSITTQNRVPIPAEKEKSFGQDQDYFRAKDTGLAGRFSRFPSPLSEKRYSYSDTSSRERPASWDTQKREPLPCDETTFPQQIH